MRYIFLFLSKNDVMDIIDKKLLLFKQAGLTDEELKHVKIVGETLDAMFLILGEKLNISMDILSKMFAIFFSAEFPKILKEREFEFSMMEEDKNEVAISATIGKCYGDLMIRFCEKNEGYGLDKAKIFKDSIAKLLPVFYKLEKDSPITIQSLFMLSSSLNPQKDV